MRGPSSARVISTGHGFVQNLRATTNSASTSIPGIGLQRRSPKSPTASERRTVGTPCCCPRANATVPYEIRHPVWQRILALLLYVAGLTIGSSRCPESDDLARGSCRLERGSGADSSTMDDRVVAVTGTGFIVADQDNTHGSAVKRCVPYVDHLSDLHGVRAPVTADPRITPHRPSRRNGRHIVPGPRLSASRRHNCETRGILAARRKGRNTATVTYTADEIRCAIATPGTWMPRSRRPPRAASSPRARRADP
jgi:hypothetical protein